MAPTREAWKDPEQGCGCSTEGPSLGATGGGRAGAISEGRAAPCPLWTLLRGHLGSRQKA